MEMGRCALAGATGGAVVWGIFTGMLGWFWRVLGRDYSATSRWVDLAILVLGAGIWFGIAKWVLEKSGSMLPGVAMKRLRLG